jgi:hypothetical protein
VNARLRVERTQADRSAPGEVQLRDASAQGSHERLAGARAWLGLTEQALAEGDPGAAVGAAQAGLDELGEEYAPDGVEDDTTLKVYAADELVADGDAEGGARMLLDLLRERAALYAERYRDAIVS